MADVNQSAHREADIDEDPEIDHVENPTIECHAWLEVLDPSRSGAHHRRWQSLARIAPRSQQTGEDITNQ